MSSGGVGSSLVTTNVATSVAASQIAAGRSTRKSIRVQNLDVAGTNHVYIGGSSAVTTGTGWQLLSAAGTQSVYFDDYAGPLFAIAAAGTPAVRVAEVF